MEKDERLENLPDRVSVADWELERAQIVGNLLLRFRYFTRPMQDLEEATQGPVLSLTRDKAIALRDALDAVLVLDSVLRRR